MDSNISNIHKNGLNIVNQILINRPSMKGLDADKNQDISSAELKEAYTYIEKLSEEEKQKIFNEPMVINGEVTHLTQTDLDDLVSLCKFSRRIRKDMSLDHKVDSHYLQGVYNYQKIALQVPKLEKPTPGIEWKPKYVTIEALDSELKKLEEQGLTADNGYPTLLVIEPDTESLPGTENEVPEEYPIDLNGDGLTDNHGHSALTAKTLHSKAPHANVIVVKLGDIKSGSEYISKRLNTLLDKISKLQARYLSKGKTPPIQGANLSFGFTYRDNDLLDRQGLDRKAISNYRGSVENIGKFRAHLEKRADTMGKIPGPLGEAYRELSLEYKACSKIEDLAATGMLFTIAGGNMGPNGINVLTLTNHENIYKVAAANVEGEVYPFSANHKFINSKVPVYNPAVTGEYADQYGEYQEVDLTGDLKPEVTASKQYDPLISKYVGRSINEPGLIVSDVSKGRQLFKKALIDKRNIGTSRLIPLENVTDIVANFSKDTNNKAYLDALKLYQQDKKLYVLADEMQPGLITIFTVEKDGKIQYDPDLSLKNEGRQAVGLENGHTSVAAPTQLGLLISEKYPPQN